MQVKNFGQELITFLLLNTGPCNRAQWSLLFPAYKARGERRGVALPPAGRLAPSPSAGPVHELPGVLQCGHPGRAQQRAPSLWSIQSTSTVKY